MQATAAPPRAEAPRRLADGNLLANPGFELGFHEEEANEVIVPDAWTAWHDAAHRRPEYKDEPYVRLRPDGGVHGFSIRVFHGRNVHKFFSSSSTHDAGLAQRAPVPAGSRVRFSAWAHSWSSDCDDPCVSPREPCRFDSNNTHGTYRVSVGIDPTGAPPPAPGMPPPASVVWSVPIVFEAYDRWFPLEVAVDAVGDHVTVYTRGNPEWPVKHNDSYWDDARLELAVPPVLEPRAWLPVGLVPARFHGTAARRGRPAVPVPLIERNPLGPARAVLLRSLADPVPPGAELVIEYPIRAFPEQENFNLPTCSDLEFEAVLAHNRGSVPIDLAEWTLEDADGNAYVFPELVLAPERYVRVWTKSGPDTTAGDFTDLYWNRGEGVWDGPGDETPWDVARIIDDAGTVVAERGYP